MALELQIILAIIGLLSMLKAGDDDDKNPTRKAFIKLVQRNLAEVSFFIDPDSTDTILRKPIPIFGFIGNIKDLLTNFTGEIVGQITDDEEQIKKNKPLTKFNKLFPVANAVEMFWSLIDSDYNKN